MNASESGASVLTITLFGPMRVLLHGRPIPRLRSRKTLWLLALLTLRHGRPTEREWLAGVLWPEAGQSQAFAGLRPVLTELRQALQGESERLQSPSRHTLLLDLDGADVDLLTFDAAMASQETPALERAVALYGGPLLEGCTEEWAQPERADREKKCLLALRRLAKGARAMGNPEAAAEFCRRAVLIDPWRDTAQREWMEALVQAGDSNAALQVYRDFVHLLQDDPQAAPDAQISALYTRLRREARRRSAAPPDSTPAAAPQDQSRAPAPITGYIPSPLTGLIGREEERLDLGVKLERARLVTITGAGGVGKTRLAIAVARDVQGRYPDGVWMAMLDSLGDGDRVAAHLSALLKISETAERSALEGLIDHLRSKTLLLVLDNCEHLLSACAAIVSHLLRECPGLQILTTSREALGIVGEMSWITPSLATPSLDHLPTGRATLVRVLSEYESVRLFVERSQAVNQTFALTGGNAMTVARICQQMEGIPLAIELAAARVKSITPEQIEAHLQNSLDLLTLGGRASLSRQQTLRGTLDWSYALLSVSETLLLARLSVFVGGWTLEDATMALTDSQIPASSVLHLLTSLVDKSLVVFEVAQQTGLSRYRLLEMVRQYAAEHLEASGQADQIRTRHSDWCLWLAKKMEAHGGKPEEQMWIDRLGAEQGNLRAALQWRAQSDSGAQAYLALASALRSFWHVYGYYSEGLKHLQTALERTAAQQSPGQRAAALAGAGMLLYCQGRQLEARATQREALELYRTLEDPAGITKSLSNLGSIECALGNYTTVKILHEEALAICRATHDRQGIALSLVALGAMSNVAGDYAGARAQFEAGLEIHREIGVTHLIADALAKCGDVDFFLKEYAAAQTQYEEALAIYRTIGNRHGVADCLGCLGNVAHAQDDCVSARALYEEGLRVRQELGELRGAATLLSCLANVSQSEGDYETARTMHRESLRIQQNLNDKDGIARHWRGRRAAALAQSRAGEAAILLGASQELLASIGLAPTALDLENAQRRMEQMRRLLTPDAFAEAWERGRAMDWEQAANYALEDAPAASNFAASNPIC